MSNLLLYFQVVQQLGEPPFIVYSSGSATEMSNRLMSFFKLFSNSY